MDNQYGTLSQAVDDLHARGYIDELQLDAKGLFRKDQPLDPSKFIIDSFHRFEGPSDPGDMSIVYAISSEELGIKGLLVGSYGAAAEAHINRMVRPLDAHPHPGHTRPVQAAPPGTNVKL
ncbi:MAG: phosphoribosylpyrophosphate synthetase [Flavobacteriales bacterium]|nr:phosphoribosylpyrophosphate synthetase [Flavobacteriales bacterium]